MHEIDFKALVAAEYDFMKSARRHFHSHPELSTKEFETAAYIRKHLDDWGIPYEIIADTSTVAIIKGNQPGKTVAIRGDIDALPVQEETGLDFASEVPGVMHACGHDAHATLVLTAAKILAENRDKLKGTVKVVFQRAEEGYIGAREIMATGVLKDADSMAGLHITQESDLGCFNINIGPMSASGGNLQLTFTQESDASGSALKAAAEIVQIASEAEEEIFDPEIKTTLAATQLHGDSNEAMVWFNMRMLDKGQFRLLKEFVFQVAEELCGEFGLKVEYYIREPYNMVMNHKDCTELALKVIEEGFGKEAIQFVPPDMSGEDFAEYSAVIPSVFVRLGVAVDGEYRPLHTSRTFVDDRALPYGEEYLLRYVFAFLNGEK